MVCAVAFRDISFVNVKNREPIDLSALNLARTKLVRSLNITLFTLFYPLLIILGLV